MLEDRAKGKSRREERKSQGPRHREHAPRPEPKERPRAVPENSPFAVLAELRRNLAARRPEGG
jgi:hypothetical protein